MVHGVNTSNGATEAVSSPISRSAASGPGGALNVQQDAKEASTAPKFGDLLQKFQAQYGAKAEKPREIKKTLGKDDFLKIMLTQMKHQDPTNPFKAEQMATEMAQFTSVEQLQNVNQNLAKMANQNQPLERLAMTGLIGKKITVDRGRFPHTEGTNESLSFNLPKDSPQVKIAIISDGGEVVLEKDVGAMKAGENSFTWDGLKSNSLPTKSGGFMLKVEAQDERGQQMQLNSMAQARVIGVSFEGAEPFFLIGDSTHQEKVTMKNIIRIETEAGMPASVPNSVPSGVGGIQPLAPQAKAPNFISFKKGEGSSTLNPEQMSPDLAQAISKYQQQSAAPQSAPVLPKAVASDEKGFPNGLQEGREEPNAPTPKETKSQDQPTMKRGGDSK